MAGQSSPVLRTTAFRVSCWTLGVLAFVEIMSAAVAVAARMESSRHVEVRYVDREVQVTKLVTVPAAAPAVAARTEIAQPPLVANAGIVAHPPQSETPAVPKPAAPAPNPLGAPPIADPVVERLVTEARTFRIAGDGMRAITKLNEAANLAPDEPSVEYELGLAHEDLEVPETAADYYQKVYNMGVTKAGKLYELAAAKLRDGVDDAKDMHGKFALGRARVTRSPDFTEGEKVVLTIPVRTAPGTVVKAEDLTVVVHFFDTLGKDIVPASNNSVLTYEWPSVPIDWAEGEELLQVTYVIPAQSAADEHLFGQRTYYGQSVELTYNKELLDVQASPRDLAVRAQQPLIVQNQNPNRPGIPGDLDGLPPEIISKEIKDFNPVNPLLPKLPSH